MIPLEVVAYMANWATFKPKEVFLTFWEMELSSPKQARQIKNKKAHSEKISYISGNRTF